MPVSIRAARVGDLASIQDCNLHCLPENYRRSYFLYHAILCCKAIFVAEDRGQVVGYVLAKIEKDEDNGLVHGHITSLAVARPYRRQGLATRLMEHSHAAMKRVYDAKYSSLHVRASNSAAFHLYNKTLAYNQHYIEEGYYADGEDAYEMRKPFTKEPEVLKATAPYYEREGGQKTTQKKHTTGLDRKALLSKEDAADSSDDEGEEAGGSGGAGEAAPASGGDGGGSGGGKKKRKKKKKKKKKN